MIKIDKLLEKQLNKLLRLLVLWQAEASLAYRTHSLPSVGLVSKTRLNLIRGGGRNIHKFGCVTVKYCLVGFKSI